MKQTLKRNHPHYGIPIESPVTAIKSYLEKKTEIDVYPRDHKGTGVLYDSVKLQTQISKIFFNCRISAHRWTHIRKLANAVEIAIYGYGNPASRRKIFNQRQFDYLFAVVVFIHIYYPHKTPILNNQNVNKIRYWINEELPMIQSIEIFGGVDSPEYFMQSVVKICPWFGNRSDRRIMIDFSTLTQLIKISFMGYAPTPQLLSKMGFKQPKTRAYSFDEYTQIIERISQYKDLSISLI